jgi:glycosyltransferase involved in cell wall biosynthesis
VSVIVPCHNDGSFLPELCHSVALATSRPHEIVIIDDGSTDAGTLETLATLEAEASHQIVRIISGGNFGLAAARNTGFAASNGPFIQFLDADDLLLPGKIDRQLDLAADTPPRAVLLDDYVECDDLSLRFTRPTPSTIASYELDFESFATAWERGLSIPIHCALFRREILGHSPFTEALRAKEDWVLWMGLAAKGVTFAYSGLHGAVYRKHLGNMTRDIRAMGVAWLDAAELSRAILPDFSDAHAGAALAHFRETYLPEFTRRGGPAFAADFYTCLLTSNVLSSAR